MVPVVNWFSDIWEILISYNMRVVEAQYLCWSSQAPEEADKAEIEYEKFKNFVEYGEVFRDNLTFHIGPITLTGLGSLAQAIVILIFSEDWQGYVTALVPDMASSA